METFVRMLYNTLAPFLEPSTIIHDTSLSKTDGKRWITPYFESKIDWEKVTPSACILSFTVEKNSKIFFFLMLRTSYWLTKFSIACSIGISSVNWLLIWKRE